MNQELKIILFNILYINLDLKKLENQIIQKGIKHKNIENSCNYPIISKYFFLLNDLHLENLDSSELENLNILYNNFKKDNNLYGDELCQFLLKNIQKLLFSVHEKGYLVYGDKTEYIAPADSIVLAFHYNDYQSESENHEELEDYICDVLNYIQFELSKKINMKIAVLKFGTYVSNKDFVI